MSCYFISATDTDAGKTYVTSLLLQQARLNHIAAQGLKPIASGIHKDEITDLDFILSAMDNNQKEEDINLYQYKPAIAPHIAAQHAGEHIDFPKLIDWIKQQVKNDITLIEGVGGLYVPLNDNQSQIDLIKQLNIPIIMIVNVKTGCINHALLSFEMIKQSGLTMSYWIANQVEGQIDHENIKTIEKFSNTKCSLILPKQGFTHEELFHQLKSNQDIDSNILKLITKL